MSSNKIESYKVEDKDIILFDDYLKKTTILNPGIKIFSRCFDDTYLVVFHEYNNIKEVEIEGRTVEIKFPDYVIFIFVSLIGVNKYRILSSYLFSIDSKFTYDSKLYKIDIDMCDDLGRFDKKVKFKKGTTVGNINSIVNNVKTTLLINILENNIKKLNPDKKYYMIVQEFINEIITKMKIQPIKPIDGFVKDMIQNGNFITDDIFHIDKFVVETSEFNNNIVFKLNETISFYEYDTEKIGVIVDIILKKNIVEIMVKCNNGEIIKLTKEKIRKFKDKNTTKKEIKFESGDIISEGDHISISNIDKYYNLEEIISFYNFGEGYLIKTSNGVYSSDNIAIYPNSIYIGTEKLTIGETIYNYNSNKSNNLIVDKNEFDSYEIQSFPTLYDKTFSSDIYINITAKNDSNEIISIRYSDFKTKKYKNFLLFDKLLYNVEGMFDTSVTILEYNDKPNELFDGVSLNVHDMFNFGNMRISIGYNVFFIDWKDEDLKKYGCLFEVNDIVDDTKGNINIHLSSLKDRGFKKVVSYIYDNYSKVNIGKIFPINRENTVIRYNDININSRWYFYNNMYNFIAENTIIYRTRYFEHRKHLSTLIATPKEHDFSALEIEDGDMFKCDEIEDIIFTLSNRYFVYDLFGENLFKEVTDIIKSSSTLFRYGPIIRSSLNERTNRIGNEVPIFDFTGNFSLLKNVNNEFDYGLGLDVKFNLPIGVN